MKPLTIKEIKQLKKGDWVWIANKICNDYSRYYQVLKIHNDSLRLRNIDIYDENFYYKDYRRTWLCYKNKEQAECKGTLIELPCEIVLSDYDKSKIPEITAEEIKGVSMNFRRFDSSEKNVFKYVFNCDDFVAESVLYRYNSFEERTVICCSTQSGCPVGCSFCGTGKRFVRNLKASEIITQIHIVLKDQNIQPKIVKKFQIMFMSMGEPLLNWIEVSTAIELLNKEYPNAQLLISTIAPNVPTALNSLLELSCKIDKIGLQFSIHRSTDENRNKLIPFRNKLTLEQIRDYGIAWWNKTGRHPYLNYCVEGLTNSSESDIAKLQTLFSPLVFNFTFSVVCSSDETMKNAGYRDLDFIRNFEKCFLEKGYNTRIFDPAGQDDIGGGCGQLWFVQQWLAEHKNNIKKLNYT